MQQEVRHTWHFDQAPEKVWDYLTKPELIEQWLMKNNFKAVMGHKFQFIGPNRRPHQCEVTELKPYSTLSYTWQTASSKDKQPFDSKVTWTLVPKGKGTELQIVHTGFRAIEDVIGHDKGWKMLAEKLVELVNAIKQ
jgi:uncharacterized protein YndB with AHSA1/START domain